MFFIFVFAFEGFLKIGPIRHGPKGQTILYMLHRIC